MIQRAVSPALVMWIALSWAKPRYASNNIGVAGSSRKLSMRSTILPARALISPPPIKPRRTSQSRSSISTTAGKGRGARSTSASVSGAPIDANTEVGALAWSDFIEVSHEPASSPSELSELSGVISDAPDRERHLDDTFGLTAYSYRIAGAKQDGPRDRRCVKQRFIDRRFSGS